MSNSLDYTIGRLYDELVRLRKIAANIQYIKENLDNVTLAIFNPNPEDLDERINVALQMSLHEEREKAFKTLMHGSALVAIDLLEHEANDILKTINSLAWQPDQQPPSNTEKP